MKRYEVQVLYRLGHFCGWWLVAGNHFRIHGRNYWNLSNQPQWDYLCGNLCMYVATCRLWLWHHNYLLNMDVPIMIRPWGIGAHITPGPGTCGVGSGVSTPGQPGKRASYENTFHGCM